MLSDYAKQNWLWVAKPMRIYEKDLYAGKYSHEDNYVEAKINGDRCLVFITDTGTIELYSREAGETIRDKCPQVYEELEGTAKALPTIRNTILDGELEIEHSKQMLWLFDCLKANNHILAHEPIEKRKLILDVIDSPYLKHITIMPDWSSCIGEGKDYKDIGDFWERFVRLNEATYEGIVLKQRHSPYELGRSKDNNKTSYWVKCRIKG